MLDIWDSLVIISKLQRLRQPHLSGSAIHNTPSFSLRLKLAPLYICSSPWQTSHSPGISTTLGSLL